MWRLRRAYEIERQLQQASVPAPPLGVTAAWDGLSVVLPHRAPPSAAPTEETRDDGASAIHEGLTLLRVN